MTLGSTQPVTEITTSNVSGGRGKDGRYVGLTTLQRKCYNILIITQVKWGTRWRSWLRHRATSWKVAGSIPDDVIAIFH